MFPEKTTTYVCIVCTNPFKPVSGSKIPAYYCSTCYHKWAHACDEPWLRSCIREEVRQRVAKHRAKKHGQVVIEIPVSQLVSTDDEYFSFFDRHADAR